MQNQTAARHVPRDEARNQAIRLTEATPNVTVLVYETTRNGWATTTVCESVPGVVVYAYRNGRACNVPMKFMEVA